MYIPKHFLIKEDEKITSFLKQNSFGELVSIVDGKPFSTHLPFLIDEPHKTVRMHIAKGNPQWKNLSGQQVLLVVSGPHGYISPAWYLSPGVPTWNYQAVHMYGEATLVSDNEELKSIVDGLTKIEEEKYPSPWVPEYAASMLQGIVGIEVRISEIQCKFKLSQNRSTTDQASVVEALSKEGSTMLAGAMEQENQ